MVCAYPFGAVPNSYSVTAYGGFSKVDSESEESAVDADTGRLTNSSCPSELIGWATTNGETTGGGDATPQTVTSASEFEDLADGDEPRVIILY